MSIWRRDGEKRFRVSVFFVGFTVERFDVDGWVKATIAKG